MEPLERCPIGPCPSERELLKLVRGELDFEPLEKVLAHTDSCENCALVIAESGLAVAVEAGEVTEPVRGSSAGLFVPGQLIASRYRIQARVGRGGMGEVYAAIDDELGERVALKIIASQLGSNPVFVEQFKRELRLARKVSHPNVCKTLEFGRHEIEAGPSQCFFTMQFIDGVTLRRRLLRGEPLELNEALTTVRDLALGLHAIHEQNIIHRDIKPDNVILALDAERRACVPLWLDFGVARVDLRESASRGLLAGTPDYAAPELLDGKVASRASDLYALGLVLHEVLVGDLPFARVGSFAEAAARPRRVLAAPSQRRSDIPAALDALLQECLSESPEHRPATALRVADRIRRIQGALNDDSRLPHRRWPSRRFWLLLPAAGALAAFGAYFAPSAAPPTPASPSSAREKAVANAARPNSTPPSPAEMQTTSLPSSRPSPALPAPSTRPKAKRVEALPKPSNTPAVPPHAVSDFGGRR